jgi:HSP20 family protein
MTYINFDPFKTVEQFARRMQEFANEFEKNINYDFNENFRPRVDISEDEKNVYLVFEISGVKKEDVKITISEDKVLTVKGSKERPFVNKEQKDGEVQSSEHTYIKAERRFGEFSRSFSLPDNINTEAINAKYENGLLYITLAKIEPAKPKEIEISVS